jgi:DMSO reductase anchor subunit
MATLSDKIKSALDESRMLMLGAQILLGFQYRETFEPGFEKLPPSSQFLKVGSLTLILIVTALLIAPGAYHRIVRRGEDSIDLNAFATRVMDIALLPFALALGIEFYVAVGKLTGRSYGITFGVVIASIALFFWYGLGVFQRHARYQLKKKRQTMNASDRLVHTSLKSKIDQALTESRVVLPGAQALLGFQFATMLMDNFDSLPLASKYVHLASLVLIAFSVIFLMATPAYHRIVERGEETERFYRFAGRMLLAAMVPLALGIAGDFFVVIRKVTGSAPVAVFSATAMLAFFYGLWFGFTFYRRKVQIERVKTTKGLVSS